MAKRSAVTSSKVRRKECKLVVIGDGACGKTSLLFRMLNDTFCEGAYVPTVFDMYARSITLPDGSTLEISLWDTAGQEDFDQLRMMSYLDADVILICYSVESIDTITNVIEKWAPEASSKAPTAGLILCACKTDLRREDNVKGHVPEELGEMQARRIHAQAHIYTSALTGTGASNVLDVVAKVWMAQRQSAGGNKTGCCTIL